MSFKDTKVMSVGVWHPIERLPECPDTCVVYRRPKGYHGKWNVGIAYKSVSGDWRADGGAEAVREVGATEFLRLPV